ncbi:hypothetical protein [Flavisolibacter tropicus]|uniref:Uncharacterized protein n=1 Tax=Flavisolibacter tropicus TaxID=1492898 RepID=A0A172TUT4_9BACT|nr:hypothetical protein [Flavisolibacter tropicus]ANE50881.1 hypothetical protein SY85_10570 [Flavisolibacter tropicus]
MLSRILTQWSHLKSSCAIAVAIGFMYIQMSCSTVKEDAVLDRTVVPEVQANVPVSTSEIREIAFHSVKGEKRDSVLHLRGQVFTKAAVGGNAQIRPCAKCSVKLSNPADTSSKANMITESDGYFEFTGKSPFNTLSISDTGYNRVEMSNLNFEPGGFNTIKVIIAAGSAEERFLVTKNGGGFTWTKL